MARGSGLADATWCSRERQIWGNSIGIELLTIWTRPGGIPFHRSLASRVRSYRSQRRT